MGAGRLETRAADGGRDGGVTGERGGGLPRRTQGYCPECETPVPAELVELDGDVHLLRDCPVHGTTDTLPIAHGAVTDNSLGLFSVNLDAARARMKKKELATAGGKELRYRASDETRAVALHSERPGPLQPGARQRAHSAAWLPRP